jgi:uncharacterized SAM-binding protein YcdF (DUF218 family)
MHLLLIKAFIKDLVLPPAGPLLVAFVGVWLIRRRPVFGRVVTIIGIGSLWLLSLPVVSDAMAHLDQHYDALDARMPVDAQAIVILGGGGQRAYAPEYGGPSADPLLLERLAYGAFLARKTGLPIMVTGFQVEAIAMRDSLRRLFGIDARWVDDRAFDTFQNARNTARWLDAAGIHRVILVTHTTHMWRAVHEFSDAGFEVIPGPVGIRADREPGVFPYLPSAGALLRSYAIVYELLGEPVREVLELTHLRRHAGDTNRE